jgi:hypothetical protein
VFSSVVAINGASFKDSAVLNVSVYTQQYALIITCSCNIKLPCVERKILGIVSKS